MVCSRSGRRALIALALWGFSSFGCGSDEGRKEDDGGAPPDAAVDATPGGDTSVPMDGASDARTDAMVDARPPTVKPTLDMVRVRQVGRFGHDLRIDVTGSDSDGDSTAVQLELFAAGGAQIAFEDTNGDGTADAAPVVLPLTTALAKTANATGFAVSTSLYKKHPTMRRARVSLRDDAGNVSTTMEVDIAQQPVRTLSQQCDVNFVENRCEDKTACRGAALTATCQASVAPTMVKVGYYFDDLGARILIAGQDVDDDVNGYRVEFLDASGSPKTYDDGEPTTDDVASLSNEVEVAAGNGEFFFRIDQTEDFTDQIKRVRVTVRDIAGNMSTPVEAALMAAPTKSSGACDPRGFDRCTNSVCTLATPTSTGTTCVSTPTARGRACSAALVLDPFNGMTSVRGEIKEPSLWDTPASCSSGDPKYFADTVVKLVLSKPATKVVLTTDRPYTSFDTAIYAFTGSCNSAMPNAAWCADDQAPAPAPDPMVSREFAVLELTGAPLPKGDYFIVVDSRLGAPAKRFQLDVTVTE